MFSWEEQDRILKAMKSGEIPGEPVVIVQTEEFKKTFDLGERHVLLYSRENERLYCKEDDQVLILMPDSWCVTPDESAGKQVDSTSQNDRVEEFVCEVPPPKEEEEKR